MYMDDDASNPKKTITISGQNNRYTMKKACKVKASENKTIVHPVISHHAQRCAINRLFVGETCEHSDLYMSEIRKKVSGYRQQDRRKGIVCDVVTESDCIEKLLISKLACHYCRASVVVLFNTNLEKKQWSLDRIDNDLGHFPDNVVVACLECNLKRGRTDMKKFEFTKALKIIKV